MANNEPNTNMITLEQIAKEAGVSRQTVANALNRNNKENWGSTAKRASHIREVAARLGYQPNGAAKAIRSGRFGCIALLLSTADFVSTLPQYMLQGIHDDLIEHNMHMTLFRLPDEFLTNEARMPKILREWMADGMLVDYTQKIPSRLIKIIEKHSLPAVWLNTRREHDCVMPDDLRASVEATKYLIDQGHSNICYVDFHALKDDENLSHYSAIERLEGYRSTMNAHGFAAKVCRCENPGSQPISILTQLLSDDDAPTAFLCYGSNDVEFMFVAAAIANKRIPEDVSLMTFGSKDQVIIGRDVTMMVVPEHNVGRRASEILREKIEEPTTRLPAERIVFDLSVGETCMRPDS